MSSPNTHKLTLIKKNVYKPTPKPTGICKNCSYTEWAKINEIKVDIYI